MRITVCDLNGRIVRPLGSARPRDGRMIVRWDGHRTDGAAVPPGIYFVRAESPSRVTTGKLTLLR